MIEVVLDHSPICNAVTRHVTREASVTAQSHLLPSKIKSV